MRTFRFEDKTGVSQWQTRRLFEHGTLSEEETHSLIRRYHEHGDLKARDKVILSFQLAVKGAALRFMKRNPHLDLAELMSEGNIGLMRAIDKFDFIHDFSSYAKWWARAFMIRHLRSSQTTVHITSMGRRTGQADRIKVVSIEEMDFNPDDNSDYDPLGALGIFHPEDVENGLPNLNEVIKRFGGHLSERELEVLRMKAQDATYSTMGKRFKFSITRAEQVYKKALKKVQGSLSEAGAL